MAIPASPPSQSPRAISESTSSVSCTRKSVMLCQGRTITATSRRTSQISPNTVLFRNAGIVTCRPRAPPVTLKKACKSELGAHHLGSLSKSLHGNPEQDRKALISLIVWGTSASHALLTCRLVRTWPWCLSRLKPLEGELAPLAC